MKRHLKKLHLQNLERKVSAYNFLILANFIKMDAKDFFILRKRLKLAGIELMVVKNSLAAIVLKKNGNDNLSSMISHASFMVFSNDMVGASRCFYNLIKDKGEKISITCGYYNGKILEAKDIVYFSQLPSLDDMRIRIMRLISYNIPARLSLCLKYLSEKSQEQ